MLPAEAACQPDPAPARIPLVYILSTGRSGSTLLDVLLGAQPRCCTLGEFQLLDVDGHRQQRCGCHRPFAGCDFWRPVLRGLGRGRNYRLDHFRSGRHPSGKVLRWRYLPALLTGRLTGRLRAEASAYGAGNRLALEAAWQSAWQMEGETAWLVDASKDPYRLHWLQASGHFDLRVVHLVRRPHGFVSNMMRGAGRSGRGALLRYTARWIVDNLIAVALLRRSFEGAAVRRVFYEDLATDPEGTIRSLCDWLGLPFDAERTRTTRYQVNHGVAGNHPRWRDLRVALRETWRDSMPPADQRLVSALTAPLANLARCLPLALQLALSGMI
jgi:hypothetical protein